MAISTQAAATDAISYEDLYARWERGNWRATELDFSVDREHWRDTFGDIERRAALWNYAMFFHGEDSVATTCRPTSTPLRARSRSTSSPPSRSTRRVTPCSSSASCAR